MLGQEILITTSNRKNNLLGLGEGPTVWIWFTREKNSINFSEKKTQNFA